MGEISHTRGVTRRRARICDLDGRWPGKDAVTDSLVRAASRLTDVRWANAVRGEYTRRVQKPHGCIASHVCRQPDPYTASDCGNHPGHDEPGRCLPNFGGQACAGSTPE